MDSSPPGALAKSLFRVRKILTDFGYEVEPTLDSIRTWTLETHMRGVAVDDENKDGIDG
jgi:hypothetical protein